jgi:DNA-binding MarR family transcriptional regulator
MTDTATLNGQDIGQAHKATNAVLERLLADTGMSFVDWVTMNAIATSEPVVTEDAITQRVAFGLKVDEASVGSAMDELIAAGLLARTSDSTVELTSAGRQRYQRVRAGIDELSARFYGDVPAADLATAHRVLALVTDRANAELAGG